MVEAYKPANEDVYGFPTFDQASKTMRTIEKLETDPEFIRASGRTVARYLTELGEFVNH